MPALTLRRDKGFPLTHDELDDNFLAVQGFNGGGGYRNLSIGGSFSINPWQRGTTFTNVADGDFTADRFKFYKTNSAAVIDVAKDSDGPGLAVAPVLSTHSLAATVTTGASTPANGLVGISTALSGYDFLKIAQTQFTLSFKVKAPSAGTYCVAFRNAGNDQSYVGEYTVIIPNTWESKTITVAASPAGGTWDYTNGKGLEITWVLSAGTDFNTSAGSWTSGNKVNTAGSADVAANTGWVFKLDQVMIERGSVASDFVPRAFADELQMCQQYYEKSYNLSDAPATVTDAGAHRVSIDTAGNTAKTTIEFATTKIGTPTVVLYKPDGTLGDWDNTTGSATVEAGYTGNRSFVVSATKATPGHPTGHWTADAEIF